MLIKISGDAILTQRMGHSQIRMGSERIIDFNMTFEASHGPPRALTQDNIWCSWRLPLKEGLENVSEINGETYECEGPLSATSDRSFAYLLCKELAAESW